ncbi:hypothetical protein BDR05DRAFT_953815 [Suillus weaverae]|nr:hypothetical protein BDR05DRAFT_953815 [Suillus weaverae]
MWGDNEESCSSWKSHSTAPGELKDISDGDIWKTINSPDMRPFFLDPQDDGELHIGVTMSLNWCSVLVHFQLTASAKVSSRKFIGSFMTPGPKEPTGSQLQNYMRLIVDDLLQLYDKGIIYHTPAYPQDLVDSLTTVITMCHALNATFHKIIYFLMNPFVMSSQLTMVKHIANDVMKIMS